MPEVQRGARWMNSPVVLEMLQGSERSLLFFSSSVCLSFVYNEYVTRCNKNFTCFPFYISDTTPSNLKHYLTCIVSIDSVVFGARLNYDDINFYDPIHPSLMRL